MARRRYWGLISLVGAVAAVALAMSGCTGRASAARHVRPRPSHTPSPAAELTIAPAGGHHVHPDKGVTVTAMYGKITSVTVRANKRDAPGDLSQGGSRWQTRYALDPGARYKVTATAVNADGKAVTTTAAFTTLSASTIMTPALNVLDGETVGVGEPIVVQFDHPVADKGAVERSLQVEASKPVTGAWSWFGRQEVDFRPSSYWPAHTRVRVNFHAAGLRASDGAYATQNMITHFLIGASQITVVNTRTHRLYYYLNGKRHWNWPESSGMHEINPVTGNWFDTEAGTFVVLYKKSPEIMSSASFGIKNGPFSFPKTPVYDAVKFTPSGNYVHSAPWSVGEQGYVNVSHGCVNLSPDRAELYFSRAQVGDIVIIKRSPVKAPSDDKTDWMYSWRRWLSHSALGAFTTSTLGSSLARTGAATRPRVG
jgi:lipoprotein-anchoring transpeptidase ErfK/SrfK